MASLHDTRGWTRRMRGWPVALLLLAAAPAHASIVISGSGLATFDHLVDFSVPSLAPDTIVTTQYAPLGLTFTPTAGGTVRANICGLDYYSSEGMPGDTLTTAGPGCGPTNTTDDSFSMTFPGPASAASFTVRSIRGDPGTTNTFTALLAGAVVDTSVHGNIIGGLDNYKFLTFTDIIFDEIRFSEDTPAQGNYFILDNVAWVNATVPEPSTLVLLGSGLTGLGVATWRFARKR